jgi:hypothetical protein
MDGNLVSKTQTTEWELEYPRAGVAFSAPQLEPPRRGWKKVCCSALTGALATSRRWYQSSIRHPSDS